MRSTDFSAENTVETTLAGRPSRSDATAGVPGVSLRADRSTKRRTFAGLRLAGLSLLFAAAALGSACGDQGPDEDPPMLTDADQDGGAAGAPGTIIGPGANECAEGNTRTCKVSWKHADGLTDCFVGEQRCEDGEWTKCAATKQ
jgi:hypothetical protein